MRNEIARRGGSVVIHYGGFYVFDVEINRVAEDYQLYYRRQEQQDHEARVPESLVKLFF